MPSASPQAQAVRAGLIAPRDLNNQKKAHTQPGDSGGVWHLVTKPEAAKAPDPAAVFKPLAVEWGGQVFVGNGRAERFAFAFAMRLTTVCHALNVELVLEHNLGALPYWGQVGHCSSATYACDALPKGTSNPSLGNVDRISFAKPDLNAKIIAKGVKNAKDNEEQIPLADVPDLESGATRFRTHSRCDRGAATCVLLDPVGPSWISLLPTRQQSHGSVWHRRDNMAAKKRELIEPHPGDKRYIRRDDQGRVQRR